MVPGEAHLVVTTAGALDGHVELVAYSHVLFLKENLQTGRHTERNRKRKKSKKKKKKKRKDTKKNKKVYSLIYLCSV